MKFNLVLAGLVLCSIVTLFSCKRKDSSATENDLYYFPEKNIYYDVKTANYYYSLDSARSWDSMNYTGADFGAALGAKISLKKKGKNPWSNNDSLRKVYHGRVLNLVNHRTSLIARADSLSRIKPIVVIKPKSTGKEDTVEVQEEPPKKGLKKFFNKLFGKKKDKKE